MAYSLVQDKLAEATTLGKITVTLDNAPAVGNVLIGFHRGEGPFGGDANQTSEGWVKVDEAVGGFISTKAWYMVVTPTTLATAPNGGKEYHFYIASLAGWPQTAYVMEWSGLDPSGPLDVAAHVAQSGTVNSLSTGTTPTTTGADRLILGCIGTYDSTPDPQWNNAWTNGFTRMFVPTNHALTVAKYDATAVGAFSSTESWSGYARRAEGVIAAFIPAPSVFPLCLFPRNDDLDSPLLPQFHDSTERSARLGGGDTYA